MRTRYLVAAVFVAVVSGLLLIRHEGYLGGRAGGGPLKLVGASGSGSGKRGAITAFGLRYEVEDGEVRVQNVRHRFVSPGLEILGPALHPAGWGVSPVRAWPPPGASGPLEGADLSGRDGGAVIGLQAHRRGFYYAQGLITDYKRGSRRFRFRSFMRLCLAIGMGAVTCPHYTAPRKARVIEGGGPSRYGVRLREEVGRLEARIPAVGGHAIRITLANQTRNPIKVADVGVADTPETDPMITSDASRPESFRLAPHGSRSVRLGFRFSGCGQSASSFGFDRLRARLDGEERSIPLSVKLSFVVPPCS